MIKKSISSHPQWTLQHKRPGTELRLINSRYYLYEYKTVYDPQKKKPRKITGALLGSITREKGFVPSAKRALKESKALVITQPVKTKEYGVVHLLQNRFAHYSEKLEKYFGDMWKEMLAIAYCRFIYRCALKNIPHYVKSSFLSEAIGVRQFDQKTASAILTTVGGRQQAMHQYMKSFITKGEYILIDGTSIDSKSTQLSFAQSGHNNHHNFEGQINLLYIYSATRLKPVFFRILPGNIREVKSFKNTMLAAGLKKVVVIADKGFYSKANIRLLQQERLSFIVPLKRDSSLVDYSLLGDNTFKGKASFFEHEKRIIWHKSYKHETLYLHLFLDDSLKLQEETDYLVRCTNNPEHYSLEKYKQVRNRFGTIALLTPAKLRDSQDVYELYKSRGYIETMFDGMKTVLEADHTYMQNNETLEGWMFINHLCLQWYQELYIELKDKELLKKISVNDYIQLLTGIKKIKINDQWYFNEFTKATEKLLQAVGAKL